ncbi:MAG: protein O-mannosyl-transferase family [Thermoanaerobaculia bacterium]
MPFGSIAVRTNIASAFFAALACALVALAAAEILLLPLDARESKAPAEEKRSKKKQRVAARTAIRPSADVERKRDIRPPSPWIIALVMLATGLLFAFSRTLWQFATTRPPRSTRRCRSNRRPA